MTTLPAFQLASSRPPGIARGRAAAALRTLALAGGLVTLLVLPRPTPAQTPTSTGPLVTLDYVARLAEQRAGRPYAERVTRLPEALKQLSFEQYQDIRYRRASALWAQQALFEVQFFHRGFNFERRVNIFEVTGAGVRPVAYSPALFEFGPNAPHVRLGGDLGFAGLRVHYPINRPGYKDEVIAFLGAAYFRVLGRGQRYGMSARALAIDTATASGEEFPYFTDFWLLKPQPLARTLTIFALLDSPGVTGAYQFEVRPGNTSQVQVTERLFPRREIAKPGIAPLTSMFLYGENSHSRHFDDVRPEVHDSDGLMSQTGSGEWLWRPLVNPRQLRVNRLLDQHPHGFGLSQRDRDFEHYQDSDARFDLRPSYWVEPLGDWGKGGIELVEIPSDEEIHDNVVAYWVPATALRPGHAATFSYLLSAWMRAPRGPPGGRVLGTRLGRVLRGTGVVAGARRVDLDFAGGDLEGLEGTQPVHAEASASGAALESVNVQRLPATGGWHVTLMLRNVTEKPVEMRCYLTLYGEALTETWTYLLNPGA